MGRIETNKDKEYNLFNSCYSSNSLINLFMIFCDKENKNGLQAD